jgi:hypothetical protein
MATVLLLFDSRGGLTEQLARRKLADAGFTKVDIKQVEGDIMNAYYMCRKG